LFDVPSAYFQGNNTQVFIFQLLKHYLLKMRLLYLMNWILF